MFAIYFQNSPLIFDKTKKFKIGHCFLMIRCFMERLLLNYNVFKHISRNLVNTIKQKISLLNDRVIWKLLLI